MAHAVTQQFARLAVGSNDVRSPSISTMCQILFFISLYLVVLTHIDSIAMQSVKAYSGFRAVNARIPQVASRSPASGRRGTLQIMNARVGGVEIPNAKPIEYSLQYIFGIGHTTAKAICADTVGYHFNQRCFPVLMDR